MSNIVFLSRHPSCPDRQYLVLGIAVSLPRGGSTVSGLVMAVAVQLDKVGSHWFTGCLCKQQIDTGCF